MSSIVDVLQYLERGDDGRFIYRLDLPAKPARFAQPSAPISQAAAERLERARISRLYLHQARAIDSVRAGHNVMISTGTASGKSLCYNLPVLEAVLEDKKARALYIYPTKALAQDQMRALGELGFPFYATYDGDTPYELRSRIKRDASVVLTNPDMLHCAILPKHKSWANFFLNLKYVVIDEAHSLRGVFGSNVANVLRRLRRICDFYGSDPRFLLASATLANPEEHASALIGLDVDVVEIDGAPRGRKFFLLCNPALIEGSERRLSSSSETSSILALLVAQELRTICFSKTRRGAELVYRYTKDMLGDSEQGRRLSPYRAGYLPRERREIEQGLFSGELLGVSTTNALELGIDIGGLDAAIINGFPGTITSAWQQAGRAGRRDLDSLAILIAGEDPLDQYYVNHPEYFFGRGIEAAVIDPGNPFISRRHAACAAYELPLTAEDEKIMGAGFAESTAALIDEGKLKESGAKVFYAGTEFPAGEGSIRGSSGEGYLVVDDAGVVLGTVDQERAFFEVHPGAIYLHKGEAYEIRELDRERRLAFAKRGTYDYYTQLKVDTGLSIEQEIGSKMFGRSSVSFGKVVIEHTFDGFQRKSVTGGEILSYEELELPPVSFPTEAFWFTTPEAESLGLKPYSFAGGLHGLEHAAISLLPIFAMCDRWDIGGVSTPLNLELERPAIFIYDGYAGGTGIARRGFELFDKLLAAVLAHLRACPCSHGCPSCVQSPKCGNLNEPLDKGAAIAILNAMRIGEESARALDRD